VPVDFVHGNASNMPFDHDSLDLVACCAAFNNFAEPVLALREMHRVLRPAGCALIIDLRPDVSRQAVQAEVARRAARSGHRAG
jgi:ubiquinone/menaquinone biosynthesis C-methylase UbiE